MEKTPRLDLNKPAKNDYQGAWHLPLNDNFQKVDEEFQGLAVELVGGSTTDYTGLKGSEASLKDRLNNGLNADGTLNFNDGDLETARYSELGLASTTTITGRIHELEKQIQLVSRLRKFAYGTTGLARNLSRTGGTPVSESGDEIYPVQSRFRTDGVGTATISGGQISITPKYQFMLAGRMYNLTRPVNISIPTSDHYLLAAHPIRSGYGGHNSVDASIVRTNTTGSGLTGTGTAVKGSNMFSATGIGRPTPAVFSYNDDCQPEVGMTLQIAGDTNVYVIKEIHVDYILIYGTFVQDYTSVAWTVRDYTQPCFVVIPTGSYAKNAETMYTRMGGNSPYQTEGFLQPIAAVVNNSTINIIDWTFTHNTPSKQLFLPGSGDFTTGSETINTYINLVEGVIGIKVVICYEDNFGDFFMAIDPRREVTIGGDRFYLPTMNAVIKSSAVGSQLVNKIVNQIVVESTINRFWCSTHPPANIFFWGVILELA